MLSSRRLVCIHAKHTLVICIQLFLISGKLLPPPCIGSLLATCCLATWMLFMIVAVFLTNNASSGFMKQYQMPVSILRKVLHLFDLSRRGEGEGGCESVVVQCV